MTSNSARILDKLDKMNQNLSTLSQSLNTVSRTVHSSAGQTEATMREMESTLRETGRRTTEEVKKLGEINGLIEMSKLASQLEIVDPLIKKEETYLQTEYDRVKHKIVILMGQYSQFYNELADSYHRDIRSLGRHIFEILENDFQRNIENRYYIGTYYKIQSASKNINAKRSNFLTTKFKDLSQTVKGFLNKREELDEDLAERIVPLPLRSRESVEIPYWIVETSDDSGAKETLLFFDSRAQTSAEGGSRYCHYSFSPENHFSDIEGSIRSTVEEKLRTSSWQQMTEPIQGKLHSALDGLVQKKFLGSDTAKELQRSAGAIELVFHTSAGGAAPSSSPPSPSFSPPPAEPSSPPPVGLSSSPPTVPSSPPLPPEQVSKTDQSFGSLPEQEPAEEAIHSPARTEPEEQSDDVAPALAVHKEPASDGENGDTVVLLTEDAEQAEVDSSPKEGDQ